MEGVRGCYIYINAYTCTNTQTTTHIHIYICIEMSMVRFPKKINCGANFIMFRGASFLYSYLGIFIYISDLSLCSEKREGPDVFINAVCYGFKFMNKIRLSLFPFPSTVESRLKKGDTDFVK